MDNSSRCPVATSVASQSRPSTCSSFSLRLIYLERCYCKFYLVGIELLLAAALAVFCVGMQRTHFMISCTAASARMPNEASDWLLPQIRIEALLVAVGPRGNCHWSMHMDGLEQHDGIANAKIPTNLPKALPTFQDPAFVLLAA